MISLNKYFLIFMIFFGMHNSICGQKLKKAKGRSQVRQESYMSFAEAVNSAIEQAKINAIESLFGTYVEQQANILIENDESSFSIIGNMKVKGEWVNTIGEPEISTYVRKESTNYGMQNVTWINCKIEGKVRALKPKAILEYKILNVPSDRSQITEFINGDQLYIQFKSPVDGFVSIFLEDDKCVYRLLPYKYMEEKNKNGVNVNADEEYVFFSSQHNKFQNSSVDEMLISTTKDRREYNYIYISFSEDEFIKPILNESEHIKDLIIPVSLSKSDFEQWTLVNKISSSSFQIKTERISIENRK